MIKTARKVVLSAPQRDLFHGKRDSLLPRRTFLLLKSMCFLIALFFAICRGEDIKRFVAAAKKNIPEMREIVQGLDRGEKRSIHDFYSFRTYKK